MTSRRKVEKGLSEPRFSRQKVEWEQRRASITRRLIESYGYCSTCAEDAINYVSHILRKQPVVKTPKNEGIEWQWKLPSTQKRPKN